MYLEDLARDTYPEMLLGAAQDLVKDLHRAEVLREQRLARRLRRRERIARLLGWRD